MVKFLRFADVLSILSNRKLLKPCIFITPDLAVEERKNEALLYSLRKGLPEIKSNYAILNYLLTINHIAKYITSNSNFVTHKPQPPA